MIAILKNAIARLACRYQGHHVHHVEVWLEPRLTITFCRRCEAISMSILCAHSARPRRAGGVR